MRKHLFLTGLLLLLSSWARADIAQVPLNVAKIEPAMTMIVFGREHKLYTTAYNDVSDLDGDGKIDVRFEPSFKYVGLFDPDVCYEYITGTDPRFKSKELAVTSTADTTNIQHCNHNLWSGNYLNYLTASKMDVIRKVLYGGKRVVDDVDRTVLAREFVPSDAHTWGKQYPSLTQLKDNANRPEFDISLYTPFAAPNAGARHLFASTTLVTDTTLNLDRPLLRVIRNTQHHIYEWVMTEEPEGWGLCDPLSRRPTDPIDTRCNSQYGVEEYVVRVEVCNTLIDIGGISYPLENVGDNKKPTCKQYNGNYYKPIGLLNEFGETGAIQFGLMTGSYRNNTQGGILRSNIRNFTDEINQSTGQILNPQNLTDNSIIKTLDHFRIAGINGLYSEFTPHFHGVDYDNPLGNCGTKGVVPRKIENGECRDWGNPLGEIVYETIRYFSGQTAGTPEFTKAATLNTDAQLGLTEPAWRNPFSAGAGLTCANKFQLLISDSTPSYDMDYVPGTPFNSTAPSFAGLNMKSEADSIFGNEYGAGPIQAYIGERSGHTDDLAPTPKSIDSLGDIRGIAPNTPTKEGGFSSAALSLFARSDRSNLKLRTFAVSIPNDVPKITINVAGKDVTLQPFGKSVQSLCNAYLSEYDIDLNSVFRPTDQTANFYIEQDNGTDGSFVVNYEDQEQGSDYDMDTAVRYNWRVDGSTLSIDAAVIYHLSCVEQHVGLVVDGTTNDGVHLLVTGFMDNEITTADHDYLRYVQSGIIDRLDQLSPKTYLDYVQQNTTTYRYPAQYVTHVDGQNDRLAFKSHVEYRVDGAHSVTTTLKDPLWFAAKYGAQLGNAMPNDSNAADWRNSNGEPQNYFLAQNPAHLQDQLREVMGLIERLSRQTSLTSLAVSAGSLSSGLTLFQASFNPEGWSGNVRAISLGQDGAPSTTLWDARQNINSQFSGTLWQQRAIFTWDPYLTSLGISHKGVPFKIGSWAEANDNKAMSPFLFNTMLDGPTAEDAARASKVIDYVKGDTSQEGRDKTYAFRERRDSFNNAYGHFLLGDIVHSSPVYVAEPDMAYPDTCPSLDGVCDSSWPDAHGQTYSAFKSAQSNRNPLLYFGANDGMLHAIQASGADGGKEVFAYIPSVVLPNLKDLTVNNYAHRYYVDGPVTVSDAYLNGSWKTVLVGTLGAGGQAIYAIDVTNPGAFSSSGLNQDSILWEFTDKQAGDADKYSNINLGYTFAAASIVRLHNGAWAAVVGNGYANDTLDTKTGDGAAHLFIIDLATGALIKDIKVGAEGKHNGLASPAVVDVDGDLVSDYVYAGDLNGNVWKFNLTANNPNDWDVENGLTPMIATGQPITVRPAVTYHPNGGVIVIFGTGKYFETTDNSTADLDTYYYGIWDKLNGTATAIDQGNIANALVSQEFNTDAQTGFRTGTNKPIDWSSKQGWQIALKDSSGARNIGERAWGDPVIVQDRVFFTTARPVDIAGTCNSAGLQGGLFSLRAADGGSRGSALVPVGTDYKTYGGSNCQAGSKCYFVGQMYIDKAINPPSTLLTPNDIVGLLPTTGSGVEKVNYGSQKYIGRQSWREVKEALMCNPNL